MPKAPFIPLSLAGPVRNSAGETRIKPVSLDPLPNWPRSQHVFDARSIWAINTALASGRPLLLRGEPGCGKSQLARAAAQILEWPFLFRTVNGRVEPEDLLYRFDAVARLAKAQILQNTPDAENHLAPDLFLLPEILWWALNPDSARAAFKKAAPQCGLTGSGFESECGFPFAEDKGVVVLIDEIDKADSEVPNSLLETLSLGSFHLPYGGTSIKTPMDEHGNPKRHSSLIIITTNEDRELPRAFVRRCLVHNMDLPTDDSELERHLLDRASAHVPACEVVEAIGAKAVQTLKTHRATMRSRDLPPPGQAELIDLLNAIASMAKEGHDPEWLLSQLERFAFSKHRYD
jgi:MoxR-like ATPase